MIDIKELNITCWWLHWDIILHKCSLFLLFFLLLLLQFFHPFWLISCPPPPLPNIYFSSLFFPTISSPLPSFPPFSPYNYSHPNQSPKLFLFHQIQPFKRLKSYSPKHQVTLQVHNLRQPPASPQLTPTLEEDPLMGQDTLDPPLDTSNNRGHPICGAKH